MRLIPEKKIESRIELDKDEFNVIVDYKLLIERMIRGYEEQQADILAGLPLGWMQAELDSAQFLLDRVSLQEVWSC